MERTRLLRGGTGRGEPDDKPVTRLGGPLLKQPLLYFTLLGAAVFFIDAGLRRTSDTVKITDAVRSEVTAQLQQTLGRPPTDKELHTKLQEWLDTELLFREAEALGLEKNDPIIRSHLASKLRYMVRERTIVPKPTEQELKHRLESQRQRYTSLDEFTVTHAFLRKSNSPENDKQRTAEALAKLNAGADPKSVGDHYPRGPTFVRLVLPQLERILGPSLKDALRPEKLHQWQAVPGPRGIHLIRLDAIFGGKPTLDSVRAALAADIEDEKREAAVQEYLKELKIKYDVDSSSKK